MSAEPDVTETAKRRLAFQKAFSQEHGGWRKKSLIADAKFETAANKEYKKQERRLSKTDSLGDEEGFAPALSPDALPEDYAAFNLIVTLKEGAISLTKVIRCFENGKVFITHVESRKSLTDVQQYQLFLQVICAHDTFLNVCSDAKKNPLITDLKLLEEKEPEKKGSEHQGDDNMQMTTRIWHKISYLNRTLHIMAAHQLFEPSSSHYGCRSAIRTELFTLWLQISYLNRALHIMAADQLFVPISSHYGCRSAI
ncbi:hypothetical protein Btru_000671 [Bulinus truncatus]|nr:hypothetical protein Btru_000671 [Bulinus truncatus]